MNEWTDGWMDEGWADGWMRDGRMERDRCRNEVLKGKTVG